MPSRTLFLASIALAAVLGALLMKPIAQDPAYHDFSDQGRALGVPNFANVVSNLPFIAVGLLGLAARGRRQPTVHATAFAAFCIGVTLVGLGSAWYHLAPSTATLVWDRLPMTIAFMAFFAIVVADRLSADLGRAMLWPAIAAGMASVGWWYWSELQGRGDLRPYGLVQFLPMLLMALMLLLFPGRGLRARALWASLGVYAVAKVAEYYDGQIHALTGAVSGHTLKHLVAAVAAWLMIAAATRDGARA